MPQRRLAVAVVILAIAVGACYHATIQTGATPSPTVVRQDFASSWVYGLVPPKTVETASQCPNGVARVETQLSFVNQLVGFLTLGIYTPMQIVVTCAAARSDADASAAVPLDQASAHPLEDALAAAIGRSLSERGPVYILLN